METVPVHGYNLGENSTKENHRPRQNGKAGNKRSVLGNVTNQVRVQPIRAAKDKHPGTSKSHLVDQENISLHSKKASGFDIFQDCGPLYDQENLIPEHDLVLSHAVTNLNSRVLAPRAPFTSLNVGVEPMAVSPMIVDPSPCNEPEEREEFGLDPYFEDIYDYLRSIELQHRPCCDYMKRQTDVTTSMRNILVDWLVEVGEEYRMHRETLFLAISYVDKFLSLVGVQRPKLQLVGAACMFIAGKYEEIYPPDVGEFVYITDDTYTKKQVLKMECVILKLLDFRMAVPTINWFADRFMEILEISESSRFLTYYLIELSLIEVEEFLQFRPSMIAATAIVIARTCLGEDPVWPMNIEDVSKYTIPDMKQCLPCLFNLYTRSKNMPQQAVMEKYKQEKFAHVACRPPPDMLSIL